MIKKGLPTKDFSAMKALLMNRQLLLHSSDSCAVKRTFSLYRLSSGGKKLTPLNIEICFTYYVTYCNGKPFVDLIANML